MLLTQHLGVSDTMQGKLIAEQYSEALDISAATPSISWSLAKSVTSALIGIRAGDGGLSVRQLATTPVWNASETAARNITRAPTLARILPGVKNCCAEE